MATLFGEIVEPTTRALIEDDELDLPQSKNGIPEWEGNFQIPKDISTLLFVETNKLNKLVREYILENRQPIAVCKNAGIEIYESTENKYIILFVSLKEFSVGQIVELLNEWLIQANKICALTSESINRYQRMDFKQEECLIRCLPNDCLVKYDYKTLEPPNLITGLGASVLTYCIHLNMKKCFLFIAYLDILDPKNGRILLDLLEKTDFSVKNRNYKNEFYIHLAQTTLSSNLYM